MRATRWSRLLDVHYQWIQPKAKRPAFKKGLTSQKALLKGG